MDYVIKNQNLIVTVSTKGGELQSIRDHSGTEFLWQGSAEFWKGRATNLFPFIGRNTDNSYIYAGKIWPTTIHGFARDYDLKAEQLSDQSLSFTLTSSPETLEKYPFCFEYCICYDLGDNKLNIRYEVKNTDTKEMYFGVGGHPGFNLPLDNGLNFSDYYLTFPKADDLRRVPLSETGFILSERPEFDLQDGNRLPLRHSMFDNDAVVLINSGGQVILTADDSVHSITVDYPDMPVLGIWHTNCTEAPFVCLEPWSALPARDKIVEDIAEKGDLTRLAPGVKYTNSWSITLK